MTNIKYNLHGSDIVFFEEINNSMNESTNPIVMTDLIDHDIFSKNINFINLETNETNETSINNYIKNYNWLCYYKINKIVIINKLLSIILHVFIMVIFEIYFYFNFIIQIEKKLFLNKINDYICQLNNNLLDKTQKEFIKKIINSNNFILKSLYDEYIKSNNQQKKLLYKLLLKSCRIAGIIGIFLMIFICMGLYDKKKINWKWILVENLLMFLFLGIFEYFFFMTIIINYNPITDSEIKYYIVNEFFNYINSTSF